MLRLARSYKARCMVGFHQTYTVGKPATNRTVMCCLVCKRRVAKMHDELVRSVLRKKAADMLDGIFLRDIANIVIWYI